MTLDIYWIGFLILAPTVAFAVGHNVILKPFRRRGMRTVDFGEKRISSERRDEARKFRWTFLQVYLLVMGSEWLQGPYLYMLLRDEKGLSESTVALLYTTAYTSAAAAAFVTGWLADRFGRRTACLAFCVIHCLASVSVLFDDLRILACGRVAGGIAITLLWTAFESWMVAEWNARNLDDEDDGDDNSRRGFGGLAAMFGLMTTANCITAITAGFLAHCVVLALGSKTDPFLIGMALDVGAAILMLYTWNENRGVNSNHNDRCDPGKDTAPKQAPRSANAKNSLKDIRVWVLSFVSCCFEGTIFLLMFFWPGALREAHEREHTDEDEAVNALPYGVTFACFMGTMVLGALLFNALARHHHYSNRTINTNTGIEPHYKSDGISSDWGNSRGRSGIIVGSDSAETRACWKRKIAAALTPTRLLSGAFCLAALSFLVAAFARAEVQLFAVFLVLEACNGVYVPSIAFHRSTIVDDEGRASVYGIMNVPLFVFVVVALCTTSGRSGEHRQTVFIFCAVLLLTAAVATMICLQDLSRGKGFSRMLGNDCEEVGCKEDIDE